MFKRSFVLIVGKILGAIFGLISGIFIARILGATNLGQYQVYLSSQTVLITMFTFGIGNASIYFINSKRNSEQEIVSVFIKLFFPLAILISGLFYFAIKSDVDYYGVIQNEALLVFVIGTMSLIISSILKPILFTKQKVFEVTLSDLIPTFILVSGIAVLYFFNQLSVSNCLFLWGLGNFVCLAFLLIQHSENINFKIPLDFNIIKNVSLYGFKLSASNFLFILIGNTSIFFLNKFGTNGFNEIGLFSRAIAISSIISIIPNAIGPLLFSVWSKTDVVNYKEQVEKTLKIFIYLSLSLALVGSLFSEFIIQLLYGSEFLSVKYPLIVLLISVLFQSISEVHNNFLASQGKANITMSSLFVSFVVICMANYILVPLIGIYGAAYSVLLSSVVNALLLSFFVRNELKLNYLNTILITRMDIAELYNKFKRIRK